MSKVLTVEQLKMRKNYRQKIINYMRKSKTGLKMNSRMICQVILIPSLMSLSKGLLSINPNYN